jgi:hypothetical protein
MITDFFVEYENLFVGVLGFMAILIIALDQFGLHEWIVEKIRGKK